MKNSFFALSADRQAPHCQVEEDPVTCGSTENDPDPDRKEAEKTAKTIAGRRETMDAILLAGGYATRLYPLTKDRPKALLPVAGKTILDYNVEALQAHADIKKFYLVTNERFVGQFRRWAGSRPPGSQPIEILSDGTDSNENRLGAVGDIKFALDSADIDGSGFLYVAGTDNIADFDITAAIDLAKERRANAVFAYRLNDRAELRRKGVVTVNGEGRVLRFVEKSDSPPRDLVVPPYYVYAPGAIEAVHTYLHDGNDPDAPGHFMAWLVPRSRVYAIITDKRVRDIGTLGAYRAVAEECDKI